MPAQFGIIGYPLGHTFSPAYFNKKFAALQIDAVYDAFPIATITEFPALIASRPELAGLSVTLPYKEAIIGFLDETDPAATAIGAVNCIAIRDGIKKGYNTDVTGFAESLKPLLRPQHKSALILGTGGASKAVAWVLEQLGISYQKVSRRGHDDAINYDALSSDMIANCHLIVNTTPLGMYPAIDEAPPIPYDSLGNQHLLYDLVYNPGETKFLLQGKVRGTTIKNGLEMLHLQAEAAWEIWNEGGKLISYDLLISKLLFVCAEDG